MSEQEQTQELAVVTHEVVSPESEQVKAESSAEGTQTPVDEKKPAVEKRVYSEEEFQDRIERATAKAAAKGERRAAQAYREALDALTRTQQPVKQEKSSEPTRDQFASDAEWIDAKVDFKLQQRDAVSKTQQQAKAQADLTSKTDAIYVQASKLEGFDREVFDELPLTETIAMALVDSDVAPKLMAYMSSNPDEVERIAKLSTARQAAEIGKLEVKLQNTTKVTKAPAPITPVGSKGSTVQSLDQMSMADYKAYRAKQGARWAS